MIIRYSVTFGCDHNPFTDPAAINIKCGNNQVIEQAEQWDFNKAIKKLTLNGWRVFTDHNGELRTKCPSCRAIHPPDPETPFKRKKK